MRLIDDTTGLSLYPSAPVAFRHALAETGAFEDGALAELLDGYPREHFNVVTMGNHFTSGNWRYGLVDGIGGADILQAVRRGHLWVNIKYLHRFAPRYAELTTRLYGEVAAAAGTRPPTWTATTLLISSPSAYVNYHADPVPNVIWHVRGRKRVYVYPALDPDYASMEELEAICAGSKVEDLTYRPEFEAGATCYDLTPGQGVMWPQNAPHRVDNVEGLNVSLSTEHMTSEARRRVAVMRANHLLRRRLGRTPRSWSSHGAKAVLKSGLAVAERVGRRLRRVPSETFEMPPTFRVDPEAPGGLVDLDAQEVAAS